MTWENQNSVFQTWLAAYGDHLEQVAKGSATEDLSNMDGPPSAQNASSGPNDNSSQC